MIATVRKRKSDYVLYLGYKDDILCSKLLPFRPPIKNWCIYHNRFLSTPMEVLTVVDGEGKAHIVAYKARVNEPLEVINHVIFSDAKYKKAYINMSFAKAEPVYVFVGEDEEGCIRTKETDTSILEDFSDVDVITDVLNGSVRFAVKNNDVVSHTFYLTKDGKPKLIDKSLSVRDLIGIELSWFTNRSEHIDITCVDDREFVCGDKGIYEIYYEYGVGKFTIEHYINYPIEMKPEQIRKVSVKMTSNNSPIILLLAKDDRLYGFGKNIHGLLGDHKEAKNWVVTFEGVEDFWLVDENATGILIKTKQGDLYYRGVSSRSATIKQDRLLLPTKKRGIVKDVFLISNVGTYIGNNIPDKSEYYYSFFLDNEDNYLIGKAHASDAKKDSLEKWYGNTILMEDLMVESCFNNDMLIKAACE